MKAIIFDLDETIFPQKPWIIAKLGMLHDELKIEKVTKEKLVDTGLRLLKKAIAVICLIVYRRSVIYRRMI
ncbi:MAG: hypothetical protein IPI62_00605 [Bacteroidetes bacterium]|nr:hypothetical protein [Bacteroidota bacterium]